MIAPRRVAVALGLLLSVAIAGLHLTFQRHAGGLWRDEVNSVNLATLPTFTEVMWRTHLDSFPLPWPALVRSWTAAGLGDTDAGLRRLGLAVGLATLGVVWWSGRRLGLDAPLVTLLLYGMGPSAIVYGGSVRGYGLGALAMAWCAGALWAFLARPGRGSFAVAQLAALAAVQTYLPNAILLAALCAGGAAVCARRRDGRLLAAVVALGAVAAVSLVTALPWVTYAFQVGALEQQHPTLGALLQVFGGAAVSGVPGLGTLWMAAPALALAGCALALRDPAADGPAARERALYVTVTAAVALVAYFVYLRDVARLPSQFWYYLSLLVLLALACDVGIALLAERRRWGVWLRIAVVALAALPVARGASAMVATRMTNVDLIARALAPEARPNDLVVVVPWVCGITFARYWQGDAPWITLPDFDEHRFHLHLLVKEKMRLGDAAIAPELARIERTLRGGGRVWLVGAPSVPPAGAAPRRLPPAPAADTGWSAAPYLDAWEAQLGTLLQRHGGTVRRVDLPDPGPVNVWERLPVFVVEGWR